MTEKTRKDLVTDDVNNVTIFVNQTTPTVVPNDTDRGSKHKTNDTRGGEKKQRLTGDYLIRTIVSVTKSILLWFRSEDISQGLTSPTVLRWRLCGKGNIFGI